MPWGYAADAGIVDRWADKYGIEIEVVQINDYMVLPLLLPRLIAATRLALGAAWLFLIAAEAIAATEGLGYRIFLVRRFLAMDVILPYVAWITLLAFAFDWLLGVLSARLFPWAERS